MRVKLNEEELIEKAELIMAVRGYENEERQKWDKGIDVVATQPTSNHEILLRVVTEPKSRSGTVGVDIVKETIETMNSEGYDKGVLIGKRFSKAAKEEMRREGIQMFSEKLTPRFGLQTLYPAMQNYIDDLCKTKCGHIPERESDCEGFSEDHYSCEIRLISDNASFHFQRGWTNLLQRDFGQLITLRNSVSNKDTNS